MNDAPGPNLNLANYSNPKYRNLITVYLVKKSKTELHRDLENQNSYESGFSRGNILRRSLISIGYRNKTKTASIKKKTILKLKRQDNFFAQLSSPTPVFLSRTTKQPTGNTMKTLPDLTELKK